MTLIKNEVMDDLGATLVIGGAGWVGSRLCAELQRAGYDVTAADVVLPKKPVEGVKYAKVDISNKKLVEELMESIKPETVFHLAALVDIRPNVNAQRMVDVNVTGTRNVVEAASASRYAHRLIYTSTLDVCAPHGGMAGLNEDAPYPTGADAHDSAYQRTKIDAEKLVLAANRPHRGAGSPQGGHKGELCTVALRLGHVWGDDDPILEFSTVVPVVFSTSQMSMVFVDNAAHAHVMAARVMARNQSGVGGRPFFITDFHTNFQEFYFELAWKKPLRVPPALLGVFTWLLLSLAAVMDVLSKVLVKVGIQIWPHPTQVFSTFSMAQATENLWVDSSRALEVLGYAPVVGRKEGAERTRRWYEAKRGYVSSWIA